ncbi:hypothetical protein R3P38DRAFT_2776632 [Favolaschia claudopus]|uniref:DUF6589 domain-containing protein n=1 Tax=Favolaschia claudopus TaxID=2862362 RepID=A0AAW0BM52_9AGAR
MGFTSRKRRASDTDYKAPSSVVKRLKLSEEVQSTPIQHNRGITLQEESDDPLPPSSAPSSPVFWDDNNEPERSEKSPVRPMSPLNLDFSPLPTTPPGNSPDGPLTSPFIPSPVKPYGGRPRVSAPHRNPRGTRDLQKQPEWRAAKLQKARQEAEAVERALAEKEQEFKAKEKQKLQNVVHGFVRNTMQGGTSLQEILDAMFSINEDDPQITGVFSKFFRAHGATLMEKVAERAPQEADLFSSRHIADLVAQEGQAIQNLLTRDTSTKVSDLLSSFNMQGLSDKLREVAPTMWGILVAVSTVEEEGHETTRRDRSLVFTTVCAMMSLLRSQKANNFQAIIALFLLGSGAAKREIEVFAHAGISLSYKSVMNYIKTLSQEGIRQFRAVFRSCMCSIVWDNLNIAFRVESQRLDSKNHFDNGTTATLIPVYNPFTGSSRTLRGTLPLSMKPERTSSNSTFSWTAADTLPSPTDAAKLDECLRWQLKDNALQHIPEFAHLRAMLGRCPEVEQIQVHKTEQYPLPAMHEDESSIDGTLAVYEAIFRHLETSSEDLEDHGLVISHGDLLTDNLVNTIEASRRNTPDVLESTRALTRLFGIFHAKMAGNRLVVNEHWGKPNATIPGGLCWEHTQLLQRKPISAGWKSKKAAPWKPCHELLQISTAGHVRDAFRICCGAASFTEWASKATISDFEQVADKVYASLYTTAAYDQACSVQEAHRDPAFENSVLYNRDSLLYLLLVSSIKAGDIGRVVLIFRIWAVMMRTPKTMPKYADAFFETLGRLKSYNPVLRKFLLHNWLVNLRGIIDGFKEVDLLQEHQNFWAKIIYNAKGVNRSWEWLSRITVCIFVLRDAMKTVQSTFKIPDYGTKHTVPDMKNEILRVAEALEKDRLQELWSERPWKEDVERVRDLLEEGSNYLNSRGAFSRFTEPSVTYEVVASGSDALEKGTGGQMDDEEENHHEDYDVTREDLEMDDEEPYGMLDTILRAATDMVEET